MLSSVEAGDRRSCGVETGEHDGLASRRPPAACLVWVNDKKLTDFYLGLAWTGVECVKLPTSSIHQLFIERIALDTRTRGPLTLRQRN